MAAPDDISAEDKLIARFFQPIAVHPGALGLSDDAAFITPPPGCDLVLKTDAIIGGVHFFAEDAAHTVASKALRVNLSDLAAKGARPLGFLLSLALPAGIDDRWLTNFAEGLRSDSVLYGCPLFGGDTDRTPGPITVSIAMFGSVPVGTMVRRAGAKPGDRVFVSGTIGDAALGLAVRKGKDWKLSEAQRQHLIARYLLPQPRNALAEAVRKHASAAMDVSDGLAGDFAKLCRISQVGASIDVERIPLSDAAKAVLGSRSGHARDSRSPAATTTRSSAPCLRPRWRASAPPRKRPTWRSLRSARSWQARAPALSAVTASRCLSSTPPSATSETPRTGVRNSRNRTPPCTT